MILKDRKYIKNIAPSSRTMMTITGQQQLETRYGSLTVILPDGTTIHVKSAIFTPIATRNLISFHNIGANNLHVQIRIQGTTQVLNITQKTYQGTRTLETLLLQPPSLYLTHITTYYTNQRHMNPHLLWHNRLNHLGTSIYNKITHDSTGIPNIAPTPLRKLECTPCSQGKFITLLYTKQYI